MSVTVGEKAPDFTLPTDGNGSVTLSGFDYEVSSRAEITADVTEPGRILIHGKLLADIAKSLPNRPVEFTTEGSKVLLSCGSSRFTLQTLPVEDYPALPTMPTARITRSTLAANPLPSASIRAVTPSPTCSSAATVAAVWILIPCFSKALRANAEISSSSTGSTRSSTSTTVTSAPISW